MNKKLPTISTNIFSEMSALANQYGATNLSQGFPDFPISETLIALVHQAMQEGYNQYAPMPGWLPLREALAQKIQGLYNRNTNPETEITITPGATYGIYTAMATLLNPGDEVLVLEPAYDSYIPNIEAQGAVAITIPMMAPQFRVDWDAVKNHITPNTKAIIINSPHNPTGMTFSAVDMKELEAIVTEHNLYLISDEVYEHIIFDGRLHESVLLYPELYKRSIVAFSFGKVFHTTGWKMGYCVAPPELTLAFRRMHQFLAFSVNTPMQVAFAEFLQRKEEYLDLSNFFQAKRNAFLEKFSSLPFKVHQVSEGSYFQIADYSAISDLPDREFAHWMTKEIRVATIPVSAFYRNGKDDRLLRFCFGKKDQTLEAAMEKMSGLFAKIV